MTRIDPEKENQVIAQMAKFEASGLTGAEFCRREGIKYTRFADWKRRFGRRERIQVSAAARRPKAPRTQRQGRGKRAPQLEPAQRKDADLNMGFAPVRVVDTEITPRPINSPIEILLPNSVRIFVSEPSCLGLLAGIVAVLDDRR